MNKMAVLAVLTAMMWGGAGCGVAEEEAAQQQESTVETGTELATQESGLYQCGLGCPAGYHAANYLCDTTCGLCTNTCFQASNCQPNDSSFTTCGSCPSGYRTNYRYCDVMCIVCGASCFGLTNASSCTKI